MKRAGQQFQRLSGDGGNYHELLLHYTWLKFGLRVQRVD